MVKALAHAIVGFARLELVNEASDQQVAVKAIMVSPPGGGPKHQALPSEVLLGPAQSKTVDLTGTVLKVMGGNAKGQVEISLRLNPEPSDQPMPGCYSCETAGNRVVKFD